MDTGQHDTASGVNLRATPVGMFNCQGELARADLVQTVACSLCGECIDVCNERK
jgi:hypothetical protein